MEALPAAPEIPLEGPPVESFDLQDGSCCCCPICNCDRAEVRHDADVKVGYCPSCAGEFTPRVESISRQVIRRISEHRAKRNRRVAEALPRALPGVPRDDFDLFRKIVDGEPEEDGLGVADVPENA